MLDALVQRENELRRKAELQPNEMVELIGIGEIIDDLEKSMLAEEDLGFEDPGRIMCGCHECHPEFEFGPPEGWDL